MRTVTATTATTTATYAMITPMFDATLLITSTLLALPIPVITPTPLTMSHTLPISITRATTTTTTPIKLASQAMRMTPTLGHVGTLSPLGGGLGCSTTGAYISIKYSPSR
jgi:hypothetical protein